MSDGQNNAPENHSTGTALQTGGRQRQEMREMEQRRSPRVEPTNAIDHVLGYALPAKLIFCRMRKCFCNGTCNSLDMDIR